MNPPDVLIFVIGLLIGWLAPSAMFAVIRAIDPEGFKRANRIARHQMIEDLRAEEREER